MVDPIQESNPFSTRYIAPGAIAYQFFEGTTLSDLATRFCETPRAWFAIVGPHGSGKSTLVESLIPEIEGRSPGLRTVRMRFTSDGMASRGLRSALPSVPKNGLAVIDGYEQLGWPALVRLFAAARKTSFAILATCHRPSRMLATLWETNVSETSERWVLTHLLSSPSCSESNIDVRATVDGLLESTEWKESRAKNHDNLRESLFDMYDWWRSTRCREER